MPTSFRASFLFFGITLLLCLFSLTANFLAVAANDGKMPVKSELVPWSVDSLRHKKMNEATRLKQLCDIYPVRNPEGQIIAIESIGDKANTASIPMLFASVLFFILSWLYRWVISKFRDTTF